MGKTTARQHPLWGSYDSWGVINRMPYIYAKWPMTFQILMYGWLVSHWLPSYLDDVIVYSKTFGESLKDSKHVLVVYAGFKLNPDNRFLYKRSVKCLGRYHLWRWHIYWSWQGRGCQIVAHSSFCKSCSEFLRFCWVLQAFYKRIFLYSKAPAWANCWMW